MKSIMHSDYWVEVPAGEFLIGISPEKENFISDRMKEQFGTDFFPLWKKRKIEGEVVIQMKQLLRSHGLTIWLRSLIKEVSILAFVLCSTNGRNNRGRVIMKRMYECAQQSSKCWMESTSIPAATVFEFPSWMNRRMRNGLNIS
jgi:hypothetical protein